ncbi:MAG: cytochrome P450 [Anaerolineae bacterium]
MIPGPATTFGTLAIYKNLIDFFRNPIKTMVDYDRRFGQLSGVLSQVPNGEQGFVFAFGANYNREVFSNPQQYHSSAMLEIDDPSVRRLANGLTFMNGDEHLSKRRLIMPAFHKKYIETYRDEMVRITDEMLSGWQAGKTVDVNQACHELTAQIAIKTLFGLDAHAEGRAMSALIAQWMTLATSPLLRIIPLDLPLSPIRRLRQVSHELEQHLYDLIARKRAEQTGMGDVLSLLMQTEDEQGDRLSDDDLIGQINVLFLAGHETSGNALTWTLFLLSQYPDVLDSVCDELDGVLGGDAPSIEQLYQLPLLEAVIKESMRVLPPVVWIQRITSEAVTLNQHQLGAGSTIILSHYMTHQNPDIYTDPQRFQPMRWETVKPGTYDYMAFSSGPRRCIGAEFAMMEMKIALAMILQRVRLEMMPNTRLDRHVTVTLSPAGGLPMRVKAPSARIETHTPTGNIHDLLDLRAQSI